MPVLDLIPEKILPRKKKAPKGVSIPPIKVERYTPPLVSSPHPVPPRLANKLIALGKRHRSVKLAECVARIAAFALILVTLQMFLDWLLDLNFLIRAVIFAADITLLVHFARRHLLPVWTQKPNLEISALMVEKHFPKLRGRVIAAVQLSRPSFTRDAPGLVQAIQKETDSHTSSLDFNPIVPTREMVHWLVVASLVAAMWLAAMIVYAPGSIALLERVFLLPVKVPRKTEVICLTGDKTIPAGETVLIEAQARGIIPSHGRVTLTDDSGRIQEIDIEREKDSPDRFSLEVKSVDHPFVYSITLNDGQAGPYEIKTVPRPNVTSIDCVQVYPPYTGLPDLKRTVGNLALLAGSKLQIHAITNSKVVQASIKLTGIDRTLPLTIGGADGTDLTGEIDIPADKLTGFSIELTNTAGVTSGDETQYRIDLIPDRPPVVQLTEPERLQELCTLRAKPRIAYTATDDYGLAKVTLCYRFVTDQDDSTPVDPSVPAPAPVPPRQIPLDIGAGHPLTFNGTYTLDFAGIQPTVTEGTTIEYWIEADDANDVTGPGIGESEHHVIKIVSEAEKKAEIMNRMDDALSVVNELQDHQSKINQNLGDAIQGRQQPPPANP